MCCELVLPGEYSRFSLKTACMPEVLNEYVLPPRGASCCGLRARHRGAPDSPIPNPNPYHNHFDPWPTAHYPPFPPSYCVANRPSYLHPWPTTRSHYNHLDSRSTAHHPPSSPSYCIANRPSYLYSWAAIRQPPHPDFSPFRARGVRGACHRACADGPAPYIHPDFAPGISPYVSSDLYPDFSPDLYPDLSSDLRPYVSSDLSARWPVNRKPRKKPCSLDKLEDLGSRWTC